MKWWPFGKRRDWSAEPPPQVDDMGRVLSEIRSQVEVIITMIDSAERRRETNGGTRTGR